MSTPELLEVLGVKQGTVFVQDSVDTGLQRIRNLYRTRCAEPPRE